MLFSHTLSCCARLARCSRHLPQDRSIARSIRRFLLSEDGPTAVEYAVMLALIIVVCLTAISAIGTNASTTFKSVGDQLGGGAAS